MVAMPSASGPMCRSANVADFAASGPVVVLLPLTACCVLMVVHLRPAWPGLPRPLVRRISPDTAN